MSSAARSWFAGLLATVLVATLMYLLVAAPTVALAAGLAWGTAAGVTHHLVTQFPGRDTGSDWHASRWIGLGVGVITFAGLLGANTIAGLSTAVRVSLAAVVFGVGYGGFATGTMAELERTAE